MRSTGEDLGELGGGELGVVSGGRMKIDFRDLAGPEVGYGSYSSAI